jgi:flagella basal body P-ring formation protein FlgA
MHRVFILLACLLACDTLAAGDIQLRPAVVAQGDVVRLVDVADFHGVSPEQRLGIEYLPLIPAPAEGLTRSISAQDVREIMSLYGLSVPEIKIAGECRVAGKSRSEAALVSLEQPIVATNSSEQRATEAITRYLQSKDRLPTEWRVQVTASREQQAKLTAFGELEITGGQAPWTGRQAFTVRDAQAPGARAVIVKADVVRVARALVAKRSLQIGDVVTADDVEVGEITPSALSAGALTTVAEAVGKEVKRPVAEGQPFPAGSLQRPVVVKRGELISVHSVAAGVQVKVAAKALADGGLGEVILLESPDTRKQFPARITGRQEAMVFVDSPKVAADSVSKASR